LDSIYFLLFKSFNNILVDLSKKNIMKEISVQELAKALKDDKSVTIIDVRDNYEYEVGSIGCLNIPMNELESKINELDITKETYIICKSGDRASAVANFLETNYHFQNIGYIIGGMQAYANEIDNSIEII